jgi:hypothetical protein
MRLSSWVLLYNINVVVLTACATRQQTTYDGLLRGVSAALAKNYTITVRGSRPGQWSRERLMLQARLGRPDQVARCASRIALTENSTSSSVVAQQLTLIRMTARLFQVLPPHQHLPES